jgi:hypothetical protein
VIKATFSPKVPLTQAATDCGVLAFDWMQTITVPYPGGLYECTGAACTRPYHDVIGLTSDPPLYGSPGCNPFSIDFDSNSIVCIDVYPYYYSSVAAATDPTAYCIHREVLQSGKTLCDTFLYTDNTVLNFFDSPSNPCLANADGTKSSAFQSNVNIQKIVCNNAVSAKGATYEFQTTLVGVLPNNDPLILPYSFRWHDSYNGFAGFKGDATVPAIPSFSGKGGISLVQ